LLVVGVNIHFCSVGAPLESFWTHPRTQFEQNHTLEVWHKPSRDAPKPSRDGQMDC
jgi:hypothetical protein